MRDFVRSEIEAASSGRRVAPKVALPSETARLKIQTTAEAEPAKAAAAPYASRSLTSCVLAVVFHCFV